MDAPPTVAPTPVRPRQHVHLTDRGIAAILVVGAMIVLAAMTVVGLTALRVTGDHAEPLSAPYASHP